MCHRRCSGSGDDFVKENEEGKKEADERERPVVVVSFVESKAMLSRSRT